MNKPTIISVDRVVATDEEGLEVHIKYQTPDGEISQGIHYLTEDDPHGFSPELRQYIVDNNPEIEPYMAPPEPTPEQIREQMGPITKRQLRLTLVRNGISLNQVEQTISDMPEGLEKQEAEIEWHDASQYNRLHPLLNHVGQNLGLTQEQVDQMWLEAINT